MVRKRCQDWDCDDLIIDNSIIEKKQPWLKKYSFPKLNLSVMAKDLEEAEEKVKELLENKEEENKSI